MTELSITSRPELEALSKSWQRAAEATPHGKPIALDNDPERQAMVDGRAFRRPSR